MNRGHSILSGNLRPSGSSPRRTSRGSLPLSKALVGFSNAKYAEGLSPHSVASYADIISKWIARIGDKDIGKVTAADPLGLPYDSC